MTDTSSLSHLIERLEKATKPDRELDLSIHIALNPGGDVARVTAAHPRGLNSRDGLAWELSTNCVLYENWSNNRCWSNGGYHVPAVTESIDAAMTLVPKNWRVNSGDFSVEGRFAWMLALTGQHRTDWFARRRGMTDDYDGDPLHMSGWGRTLPIALCIAALKAQLSTRTNEQDDACNLSGVSSE